MSTATEETTKPSTTNVTVLIGGKKQYFTNVPTTVTKEQLREKAIANGKGTVEEWHEAYPELTPFADRAAIMGGDVVEFVKDQATTVGGLGGAFTGGVIGSVVGPVGTAVGTILGGAVGTGGGSLLSDHFEGNDLNYANAVREAGISLGIDIATLGAAKVGKTIVPLIKNLKNKGDSPETVAQKIIDQARAGSGEAGSLPSLQATQKFLNEAGATLDPYQTGQATGTQLFGQKIGAAGILSGRQFEQNTEAVNKAVNSAFNDIMTIKSDVDVLDKSAIGEVIHGIIEGGKQQLSTNYGNQLDTILPQLNKQRVSVAPLRQTLKTFKLQGEKEFLTKYDDKTVSLIDGYVDVLNKQTEANPTTLIQLQKNIANDINKLRNAQDKNPQAVRELTLLSNQVKESIQKTLDGVDPKAGEAYRKLNMDYAKGMDSLTPKITENILLSASKGQFEGIGKALAAAGGSINSTKALLNSVDESFKLLGKNAETFAFKNAAEAKEAIRAGYLKGLFPNAGTETFKITDYAKKHAMFNDPKHAPRLKLILGDKYKSVKQLTNVMAEASGKPKSNIGELALRAREFAAAGVVGSAMYATGFNLASLGAAALVFGSPYFLAKASLNPKTANRILAFEKRDFKGNVNAKQIMITNIIVDVMREMSSDEQQELMDSVERR